MALFNTQDKILHVAAQQKSVVTSQQMSSAAGASRPHHGYHLVDPSPWPA